MYSLDFKFLIRRVCIEAQKPATLSNIFNNRNIDIMEVENIDITTWNYVIN